MCPCRRGRREARGPVVACIVCCDNPIDGCRTYERVDIAGIERQGALKENARLQVILRIQRLIQPSHPLKIEVHRVGIGRPFRAPRLGTDQLHLQLIGEPRDDLVLHVEEIGQWLLETLGPKMTAALGVDQLRIDPDAALVSLH